jgi:pimeloyl-ACP methyl ester carboxylesterase
VLYQCLSGILPTEADNIGQIIKVIVTKAIPPLRAVAPHLPAHVCSVVDRMLTLDRAARPALEDVARALRGVDPLAATVAGSARLEGKLECLPMPETRYAEAPGRFSIAYQVFGEGPLTLVMVPGIVSHIEAFWEEPEGARFFSRLGSFARVVVFDKRGSGLSDRIPDDAAPTLEERIEDLRAVVDAADVPTGVLMGISEGGPMSALFAATCPERLLGLVLYGTAARFKPGPPMEAFVDLVRRSWGQGALSPLFAPGAEKDPRLAKWFARIERLSATPRAATALAERMVTYDVRAALPRIRVPTLVLHRGDDALVSVGASRALAKDIPGARLIEYPTGPHHPMAGDYEPMLRDIETFMATLG